MNFSETLIFWYINNKRDLPWRHTKDPYAIWLSEVILQQTRVEQGLPYYEKFIQKYSTVNSLAEADEDEVLKMWQGLGYYSRARNLLATAKSITNEMKGVFPDNFKNLKQLKGVGEYTAAAIASFAYNLPHPVIDGNVIRVLARVFGIKTPFNTTKEKKIFHELAEELIDKKNPDLFNQAIMEFGAIMCKPQVPSCHLCPFQIHCFALKNGSIESLPYKSNKIKQKERYFHYFHIKMGNQVLIQKRTGKDIWKNLFEFPLLELTSREEISTVHMENFLKKIAGNHWELKRTSNEYKHILTHQILYARFYEIKIKGMEYSERIKAIDTKSISKYAIPKLIDKYLKNVNKISGKK